MKKFLGLAAIAAAIVLATPAPQAKAVSLAGPGDPGAARFASERMIIDARHGGGGYRGGGLRAAGFGPRRFHGGGPRFYGGHRFHGGPRFYRQRYYYGGPRFGYGPSFVYGPRRVCRWVPTYYGPRRICRFRPWPGYYGYRPYRYAPWRY